MPPTYTGKSWNELMTHNTREIEELTKQLFQYYDDIDCAETVNQRITAKEQAELWLKRTLHQQLQKAREEAVAKRDRQLNFWLKHDLQCATEWDDGNCDCGLHKALNHSELDQGPDAFERQGL